MVLEVFKRDDKATELDRAINDTYFEMVACVDPRKQRDQIYKALVANREEYPIPNDVLRINHPVRLQEIAASNRSSESQPLRFLTKQEYDEIEPYPNALTILGGTPWGYTFYKNSILVTDIPNVTGKWNLEINIGGEPTRLSAASDEVIFSPTWDEVIKAGSLARLYAGISAWDRAKEWRAIYRYGFAGDEGSITGGLELFKKLNEQVTEAPRVVRPTYF